MWRWRNLSSPTNGWKWNSSLLVETRLPGISIEPVLPERPSALPRMDIALFAGFAARGPCNIAIAVDSVAAYEACFGGDLPLARDRQSRETLYANLPAAVRGFFANGGRRCWVVRLARTERHEARWTEVTGRRVFEDDVATSNPFAIGGMLCRLPGLEGGDSKVRPAWLEASSVGSWSDDMEVSARIAQFPFIARGLRRVQFGLAFADPGGLVPGDLIEFIVDAGMVRRYAKVVRIAASEVLAIWCASLARTSRSPELPVQEGTAQIVGQSKHYDAVLTEGVRTSVTFETESRDLQEGRWLHFWSQGESVWMLVERIDGPTAYGTAWQQVASRLPRGRFTARKVSVDLRVDLNGVRREVNGLNPGLSGAQSLHALWTDDEYYSDDARRHAAQGPALCASVTERDRVADALERTGLSSFEALAQIFDTPAFGQVHRDALRAAWLPIGLDTQFAITATAAPQARDALARDGLSLFDDSLFLDPALATLTTGQVMPVAERIRDLEEGQLTGIHAGLHTPDRKFGIPSIFAVPDSVQPGWREMPGDGIRNMADPGAPPRALWRDHDGGCRVGVGDELPGPDFRRFLDCGTRLVEGPNLSGPRLAVRDGTFTLRWSGGALGATFVLEESGSADFIGAVEIYRGPARRFDRTNMREGAYFYRVYAELVGNVSNYSAVAVLVSAATFDALPADSALLRRLHLATIRMAAGSADMFALLSMPQQFRSAEALRHVNGLRHVSDGAGLPDRLGRSEERALSYAALYHPWVSYRTDRNESRGATALASCPPDGVAAGQMAQTAAERGSWIAPANDLFVDIVGLSPAIPDADQLLLYSDRVNMVLRSPRGFVLMDADTLSAEPEWQQISVRRLMILLRRLALVRGETYVFEPNGDVMRRAVERDLSQALEAMHRRGAFAGKTPAQSFRVAADRRAGDQDNGRMVFEIGVAPSQPLRFLNVRLVQQGGRLTVAEEAA